MVIHDVSLLDAVQLQFVDEGLTVTVPVPPLAVNVWEDEESVYVHVELLVLNTAVTAVAAFIVTTHVPVPEHPPPLHPVKLLPESGVAVRVTDVPDMY
jgi:hypothetical protein